MTSFGSLPPYVSGAAAAAGGMATGLPERIAKLEAAGHALATDRATLSSHPLDGEANTSADRDTDGRTGGNGSDSADSTSPAAVHGPDEITVPTRAGLPDDFRGGRLDVIV